MHRIISKRAPYLVSNICTLHPAPNRTLKLLRRVNIPAPARLYPNAPLPLLGHATFFSSKQMMELLGDSKQLAQPAHLQVLSLVT
jgi:hypothetical protein